MLTSVWLVILFRFTFCLWPMVFLWVIGLLGFPDLATDLVSESSDDPQLFRNPLISPFLRIRQTSTSCDDVRVYDSRPLNQVTAVGQGPGGTHDDVRLCTGPLAWTWAIPGMNPTPTCDESHVGPLMKHPPKQSKTQLSGQVTFAATKSDKELSALTIRFETWIQVDMKNDQGVFFCWSRQTYANITCKHVTPLDFVAAGRGNTSHSWSKTKESKKAIWKDRTDRVSSHWQALKLSGKGFWLMVPFRSQLLYCSAQLQLPSFWPIAFCPKSLARCFPKTSYENQMKINMSCDFTPKWTNKTTLLRCGSSMLLSLLHIHFLCQSFLERCCKGCLIHLSLKPFGRLHQGEYRWLKGLPNL